MNVKEVMSTIPTIQNSNQVQNQTLKLNMEQHKDQKDESTSKNISKDQVQASVDKINDFLKPTRHNLQFELHEELEKYYVTVVNPETDEVVREIPPRKMLDMYAKMAEYMGFLVDEKV